MQTSWVDLLHWTLSCLLLSPESGVDCPCPWFHTNSLCCPAANCLSAVQRQLPSSGSPVNCLSRVPVVNPHSRPLPTSGYGEISCPRILCLFSRQNRQRNRLIWRPTHIVLQYYYNFIHCEVFYAITNWLFSKESTLQLVSWHLHDSSEYSSIS